MKAAVLFVGIVLIGLSAGSPAGSSRTAGVIIRQETRDPYGQYALQYLTPTGILVRSQGSLKPNAERNGHVLVQRGSYRYTSPEGEPVEVSYIADEGGFRAVSNKIPVAPQPLF